MRSILEPFMLGELALPNRVVMGPMTRARAPDDGVPTAVMAEYYAQRASAGLIITEGVFPDLVGKGYFATPGIETQAQTEGWKRVTDAVHARGGRIVMQLMHCGRVGHQANNPGVTSVSPSGVPSAAMIFTRAQGMQTHSSSRALDTQEVVDVLDKVERAAGNAKAAGFDGIELHAASGYLPNQFLASNTNLRTDRYGGSPQKRGRFVLEAMERLFKVFGHGRAGIKIAPGMEYNDIHDETVEQTYDHLVRELERMKPAYLHFQTPLSYENVAKEVNINGPDGMPEMWRQWPYEFLSERFTGPLIASGDLTFELAGRVLDAGKADLFVFGRSFVSNPDLVERFRTGAPLTVPDVMHFYGGDENGYTTYPRFQPTL